MMNRIIDWLGKPRDWIDPKNYRLWLWLVLLVYTLSGFFLAPYLVQRILPGMITEALSRPASIQQVRINPFVLSAEVRGFRLDDTDGSLLFGFDRLYVNFQSTSLFHWAWTFADIQLEGAHGRLHRDKDGTTNIGKLLDGLARSAPPSETSSSTPLRLIIGQLRLDKASLNVLDESRPTPFRRTIGPISIVVNNLNTLPQAKGTQQVVIDAGNGVRLAWNGNLALRPLRLTGHVTATGPLPLLAYDYLKDQLAFSMPTGDADIGFDYAIGEQPDKSLSFNLSAINITLRHLAVRGEDNADILDLSKLGVEGGRFTWPAQQAHVDRLLVSGLTANLVRAKDGELNVLHLLRAADPPPPAPNNSVAKSPLDSWNLGLGKLVLQQLKLTFDDRTLREPGTISISDADASVSGINNKSGARFPLQANFTLADGGDINVVGDLSALPKPTASLKITATDLACRTIQPWLANVMRVKIDNGTLGFHSTVTLAPSGDLAATGDLDLADLAITDIDHGSRLLGWHSVSIDRFDYDARRNQADISTIDVKSPYAGITVNKDKSTNVQALMVKQDDAGKHAAKSSSAGKAMALTIGRVRITKGSADFSDNSLPLPFHAGIEKLGGEITTLSTTSRHPARIKLQGQVGSWGLTDIHGTINPLGPALQTNVSVIFRNIDFPDLSPYTIKFAGRKIASGRLDLNLNYKLDKGALDAKNNIVIHDFKLGDKVDEPGAMHLPLGLAVALLEDKDGKIDLDVPVTGNVDDPQFSISGVIMKAFSHIIVGIVASPFRLLGKLVGAGSSEDFGQIDFEPGLATLSPPAKEKLAKLAQALKMRPSLSLKVPGAMSPDADSKAIQTRQVDEAITAATDANQKTARPALYAKKYRKAVESLFTSRFPGTPLATIKTQHMAPPQDQPNGKPVLDDLAYVAALRDKLIDAEVVSPQELEALAAARSKAIVEFLTSSNEIGPGRIASAAGKTATPTRAGWIPVKLDVDIKPQPAAARVPTNEKQSSN